MTDVTPAVQRIECVCSRPRWGFIGASLRFIGCIVVLIVVFAFGAVSAPLWWQLDVLDGVKELSSDITSGINKSTDDSQYVFGIIRKVSGNSITIADNGGGFQVVTTTARTTILGLTGELPVSSLRFGQAIRVSGVASETGTTAQSIEVIR